MSRFERGHRIMYTSNPDQRGEVVYVHGPMGGQQYYDVRRDDGGQETVLEHDLTPEVSIESAWDRLSANMLGSHDQFGIATTMHKVKNTTNNTISSLRASRTLFKPYQYKPLVKFLQSDTKRVLIADEVGLGKTIEAGHIMLELRGRKMLRNALVVCPKSLRENWQVELREKFNFEFKLYETVTDFVNDLRQDINKSQRSVFGIVNYEKLRSKKVLDLLEEQGYMFDLMICDESHRLRNSTTQLHAAFTQVVGHMESIVFLTATPIMNGEDDLFNQVRLLEEERYKTAEVFQNAVSQNRPFIRALTDLNKGRDLAEIAHELHAAEVTSTVTIGEEYHFVQKETVEALFGDDPLYQRARKQMLEADDTPEDRARIQYDLSELNSLNHLYTRTRKRHVSTDASFAERNSHRLSIDLSDQEQKLYREVEKKYDGLGVIQHKRMITSSIVAYHTPDQMLREGDYLQDIPDSKFEAFRKIADRIVRREGKKLIVFSTFKATLRYLEIRLEEMGIGTTVIHGDVDNRAERVQRFKEDPNVDVLLSSQVGREGLNMQFCDVLVNYDLPWNPMRVEQRIGRIDRIGQRSKVVNIYSFTLRGTIEERIHTRLLEKIGVFQDALGDIEEILGEEHSLIQQIDELEQDLYRTELTEEEQNRRIDEVRKAFETEKQNLEHIERELTDAIVNDIHFQNEIERIVRDRRYLTDRELQQFVSSLFRDELSTHTLEPTGDGRYLIRIPNNDREALFRFIEQYKDDGQWHPELNVLYRKFKGRHWGERSIAVTFNQRVAYEADEELVFINSYHPLINAAANYFEQKGLHQNQAYRVAIDARHLDEDLRVSPGHYVLAVYKIKIEKTTHFGPRESAYLHAALVDLNGEEPTVLDEEVGSHVLGQVQQYGTVPDDPVPFVPELVDAIRSPITMAKMQKQRAVQEDEQIRLDSSVHRRRMQHQQFYENQIRRRKQLLKEGRGIRDIVASQIDRLETEMRRELEAIEALEVACRNEIVSVNHLEVI